MTTSGDGARIKVFGGIAPTSTSLSSGGGTGYVRNVTYNGIHDVSDDCKSACFQVTWYELIIYEIDAIELTQCYGQSNITACNLYPVRFRLHITASNRQANISVLKVWCHHFRHPFLELHRYIIKKIWSYSRHSCLQHSRCKSMISMISLQEIKNTKLFLLLGLHKHLCWEYKHHHA